MSPLHSMQTHYFNIGSGFGFRVGGLLHRASGLVCRTSGLSLGLGNTGLSRQDVKLLLVPFGAPD